MRVLIDGAPLLMRSGGVKNYLYYWLEHLRKLAGPDVIRIFPYLVELGVLDHERSVTGWMGTYARLAALKTANYCGPAAFNALVRKADLFHGSNIHIWNPPTRVPFSATLHDLTCWLFPELHLRVNVAAARRFGEVAARRARAFIAVSEATRADAVKILRLRPEQVRVIYQGVADPFFHVEAEAVRSMRNQYGLMKPYILFVGTLEPRKNIDLLLDAYERLPLSCREEFELVICGPIGWAGKTLVERLRSAPRNIRYLGYVRESDLPALTAGATVFAYVSLYEGFGLPVAQAMAAGVPVVTSNVSALPEVAGDAALLVSPRSVEETRAALERLLLSPDLRARLAENGRRRAGLYRWRRCAEQSLEFFREVIGTS